MGRGKPAGIETRTGFVSWNGNSGMSAISLAYHLGAKTIILLGFDMQPAENGQSNYHNEHIDLRLHKKFNNQKVYDRYLTKTMQIAKDARQLGLTIINCSSRSKIDDFPVMTIDEVIANVLSEPEKT
jgi:hypothetical protein